MTSYRTLIWWHNVKELVFKGHRGPEHFGLMRWNGDFVAQDLPRLRSPWRAHTGAAASAAEKVKGMAGEAPSVMGARQNQRLGAPLAMNEI
jgi:hypothetical protein